MSTTRHDRNCNTATLLNDGRVLVIGSDSTNQSQIYNPTSNAWESTSDYLYDVQGCPYSGLLPDGNALVVAGQGGGPSYSAYGTSSWIDSSNGLSGSIYSQSDLTYNAKIIPLNDGRMAFLNTTSSGELWTYDPNIFTWTNMGDPNPGYTREAAYPVKLDDGRLLIANGNYYESVIPVATFFDPMTNTFSNTSDMNYHHFQGITVNLGSGLVLSAGGWGVGSNTSHAEVYDVNTNIWTPVADMNFNRVLFSAVVLQNAKVLVAGGGVGSPVATAEIYDPNLNTWTQVASMNFARSQFAMTLLQDGRVLVTGGGQLSEIYDPLTDTWSIIAHM
jgi:hypothetical protein